MNLDHLPPYDIVCKFVEVHGGISFLFVENMFRMPDEWLECVTSFDERPDLTDYWKNAPLSFWHHTTRCKPSTMHWPQHPVQRIFEDPTDPNALLFLESDYECFNLWFRYFHIDKKEYGKYLGNSKILDNYFLTVF